ncbi:MAG TPA: VOC family protein [Nocardioides sp.]|uniref:VOC family protein n=1 Tax=uncultured Nocardioides sp. TaxID=198441 RepID=UPI000EB95304|nr:VOC family protein [uncultured Nocardioides sp.]HCB05894.1 methylmalonyl-CoA epimerase [Nocardioides sp.]HRD61113.1 VOC family protein [Nocardioides sp.]HRI95288.1 VOC family protein [Nocardioides sp.]HRK44485.1 VOC family protein [Nocardioides sp.]
MSIDQAGFRRLPFLAEGQIVQIGIVVPDLKAALRTWSAALGLGPWIGFHFTPETVQDFTYRGEPATYSIDIAMTGAGPQVELIEVHGEQSLYHEWTDVHGYGIQHLGIRVAEMEPVKQEMLDAGYELIQSGHGYGAAGDGAFAYFDTLEEFGTIFELIQVPAERRTPDFVWPDPV